MRLPALPPDMMVPLQKLARENRLQDAMRAPLPGNGAYLHWDDLRRRPPPDGLTHEEWWAGIKVKRLSGRIELPFYDKSGIPFSITEPPVVRSALRSVDLHWGGALQASSAAPTPGQGRNYLLRSLAEEPFSSSFLEGAATTREIAKELIFKNRQPKTRDERMVLNNYHALTQVKRIKSIPLTVDLILALHRTVTLGTLNRPEMAGVLRGPDDGVHVFDGPTDEILHTPPPAEELPERLKILCDFVNAADPEESWLHPVMKAIIVHFMIGYDHPFIDGNGRTARALFYLMMLKSEYWLAEYVSISSVIKDAPVQYGRAYLETETDDQDMTYFVVNQCKVVAEAERRLYAYIERKGKEVDNLAAVIEKGRKDGGFNHRQMALLNDLVRGRVNNVSIALHQNTHSVSYHTARNDLEELTSRRYLSKRRFGRDTVYYAAPNLDTQLLGVEV